MGWLWWVGVTAFLVGLIWELCEFSSHEWQDAPALAVLGPCSCRLPEPHCFHAAACMGSTLVDKVFSAWAWVVAPPVCCVISSLLLIWRMLHSSVCFFQYPTALHNQSTHSLRLQDVSDNGIGLCGFSRLMTSLIISYERPSSCLMLGRADSSVLLLEFQNYLFESDP
jgi:hypothetical protein